MPEFKETQMIRLLEVVTGQLGHDGLSCFSFEKWRLR